MIIWYKSKPSKAVPLQTSDGRIKLWCRGVFGFQFGSWFFGAVNGSREIVNDSTSGES